MSSRRRVISPMYFYILESLTATGTPGNGFQLVLRFYHGLRFLQEFTCYLPVVDAERRH